MSGFRAPQIVNPDLPIHRLGDEQFLTALDAHCHPIDHPAKFWDSAVD
jgi:hypothetical protein